MFGLRINVVLPVVFIFLTCVFYNPSVSGEYCRVRSSGWNTNTDVKLTLMFSMRKHYENGCGIITSDSLQHYVAVKWALDQINSVSGSFLPVKIGFQLYDDCRSETFAARNALALINPTLPEKITDCIADDSSSTSLNIGIVGPSRSTTTIAAGNVLRSTDIPIITPSATLSTLSNKTLYPNILRTAVSDTHQVEAIIQILKAMDWSYVAVIYTPDAYGQNGMEALKKRAKEENICIAKYLSTKPTIVFTNMIYELKRITYDTHDNTLAVIFFGHKDVAENLLYYASRVTDTNGFHWIMSDAVGQNTDVFKGVQNEPFVSGALTVSPSKTQLPEFSTYYSQILKDVKSNVVNDSLISEMLQQGLPIPEPSFKHNDYVPLTLDAVYALTVAFRNAHGTLCTATDRVCDQLKVNIKSGDFLKYVQDVIVDYSTLNPDIVPPTFKTEQRRFKFNSSTGDVERAPNTATYVVNSYDTQFKSFVSVGNFSGNVLKLDKSKIKMMDSTGKVVTGDNLPQSRCSTTCKDCIDDTIIPMVHVPGDVYIIGIFSLHNSDPNGRFGCSGFRNVSSDTVLLESFLHAVKAARKITGIDFGAIAFDDCYSPLRISTILSTYFSGLQITSGIFSYHIPWNKVVCAVGGLSSGVTIPLAEFFAQLNIPVVSYAASSPDLDDKTNFPYFLRTVPSDEEQAEAMAAVIELMEWEYVDLLYVGNNYGTKGKDAFTKMATDKGICVGDPIEISEIDGEDAELYKTINELQQRQAHVVVFFGIDTRYSDLLKALNNRDSFGDFIFLASEEWGTKEQLLLDGKKAARGTITLSLASPHVEDQDFVKYMLQRNLDNTENNPWFKEFWQHIFKCNIKGSYKNVFSTECSEDMQLNQEYLGAHLNDQRVYHVRSAVMAVTKGMQKTKTDICSDGVFPCKFYYDPKYSPRVLEHIRSVELKAKASDSFFRLFDDAGNGAIGFKIYNIQQQEKLIYKDVGYYTNQGLTLRKNEIKFYNELGDEITVISSCESGRCEKCQRIIPTSSSPISNPIPSTHIDDKFRLPDIILVVLVGVIMVFFVLVIITTCCYFSRKMEALSKHVQAVENQHMYEPVRDIAYQNRQAARFHPGQDTIKFVNPSLNSLGSLTNGGLGINNQAFIQDDHYIHANGSILSNTSPQGGILGVSPNKPDITHGGVPGQRISGISSPHQSLPRVTSNTIASPLSHYYGDQMYMEDPVNHGSLIGNGHISSLQANRGFRLPIQVPYTPSAPSHQSLDERVEYSDVVTPPEPSEILHPSPQHIQQSQFVASPSHSDHSSQTPGTPYQMSPTTSIQSNSASSFGLQSRISPTDVDPHGILRKRNVEKIPKPPRQNLPPPVPQKVQSQLASLNRDSFEGVPMNDVNSPQHSRNYSSQNSTPILGRNSPGQQGISMISAGIPSYPHELETPHDHENLAHTMGVNIHFPQYPESATPPDISNRRESTEARISRV